jgi:flagellar FliL protein
MSSAATEVTDAPAPKKSKKKLLIIVGVVVVLLAAAGVGGVLFMQQKARAQAAADEEAEEPVERVTEKARKPAVKDAKSLPVFLPIEAFTVNLADRDGSRYAQVTITLELDDAKTGDLIKGFMPAVRNNVLLLLSGKTSAQLLDPQGKVTLAKELQREVLRPLGVEVEDPDEEELRERERKRKKPRPAPVYPVRAVHFSNFIVQ